MPDNRVPNGFRHLEVPCIPPDPRAALLTNLTGRNQRLQDLLDKESIAPSPPEENRREFADEIDIHSERQADEVGDVLERERIESKDFAHTHGLEGTLRLHQSRALVPMLVVVRTENQDGLPLTVPRQEVD